MKEHTLKVNSEGFNLLLLLVKLIVHPTPNFQWITTFGLFLTKSY